MTWEVSALLGDVAPRVLQYLYANAKPDDAFVAGAGMPGYTYPHFQPDPKGVALQSELLLQKADLPFISVLNANEGTLAETDPLLALPEVRGILYKDYAPYNRSNGALHWSQGKPCLSYKFLLWENIMGPEELARGRREDADRSQIGSEQFCDRSGACLVVRQERRPSGGGPKGHRPAASEYPRHDRRSHPHDADIQLQQTVGLIAK